MRRSGAQTREESLNIETEREFERHFFFRGARRRRGGDTSKGTSSSSASSSATTTTTTNTAPTQNRLFSHHSLSQTSFCDVLRRYVPALRWMPAYPFSRSRGDVVGDLVVGITLAFVIAPKAMAHALLAEVPPVHGIYTAFTSTLIYGVFGTSAQLSVGTCALPAMMYGEALLGSGIDADDFESAVPTLTFLIGLVTLIMAALRLETLTAFIPPCALSAFTTCAAFLIGTSQVKYMLGLDFKADGFVQTWIAVFENIKETHLPTLVLSVISVGFLLFCKKFSRAYMGKWPNPAPVLLVVGSTLLANFLGVLKDVDTVGEAPTGIRILPVNFAAHAPKLLQSAVIIALINYVLATSIAKSMSAKAGEKLDASQELRALSAVNLVGGFFGGFVAGGSFSGSAIIASLTTPSSSSSTLSLAQMMHNIVNSVIMLLILTVVLPLLAALPKATLGSIIVVALPRLVDFSVAFTYVRVRRDDFYLWTLTFVSTLFGGVQIGLGVAVLSAVLALVRRASSGDLVVELGVLPGTVIYRSRRRFPDARRLAVRASVRTMSDDEAKGDCVASKSDDDNESKQFVPLRIFRLDASLHFGNAERIESKLDTELSQMSESGGDVGGVVVLSCTAVNYVDTAAISMLTRFARRCESRNVALYFSGWKSGCRATLYRFARREEEIQRRRGGSGNRNDADDDGSGTSNLIASSGASVKPSTTTSTTPANAPQRAMDRLTIGDSRDARVTVDMPSMKERGRKRSPPLDPNRWFLALHDFVRRSEAIVLEDEEEVERTTSETASARTAALFSDRMVRARVRPRSYLVGKTPREVRFRGTYDGAILRVVRDGETLNRSRLGRVVLESGDLLTLDVGDRFDATRGDTARDLEIVVDGTKDLAGGNVTLTIRDDEKEATEADEKTDTTTTSTDHEAIDRLVAVCVDDAEASQKKTRKLSGQTVEDAGLRGLIGLFLVAVRRGATTTHAVGHDYVLNDGDICWFAITGEGRSHREVRRTLETMSGLRVLRVRGEDAQSSTAVGASSSSSLRQTTRDTEEIITTAEVDPETLKAVREHAVMVGKGAAARGHSHGGL